MQPYEKVVHERRGAPGNSYIVSLFWDPADGAIKVREYRTARRRESRQVRSLPEFLALTNPRWPDMYKKAQGRVRQALLTMIVKSGGELVEDLDVHRT